MSISENWARPNRSNLKSQDLDAVRRDIWGAFAFGVHSAGRFVLNWNLTFTLSTLEGLPTERTWANTQTAHKMTIKWNYSGDLLSSIQFEYDDGATSGPTAPGTCTPVYDAQDLLDTYTWS